MKNTIEKINFISEKRLKWMLKNSKWYKWNQTYFDAILWEMEEVKVEIKDNNSVYLEDELWDILWTYLGLLNSLKEEWKITSVEKVFNRCFTKFSWRLNVENWENNWIWEEVKEVQKEELEKENNEKYWK